MFSQGLILGAVFLSLLGTGIQISVFRDRRRLANGEKIRGWYAFVKGDPTLWRELSDAQAEQELQQMDRLSKASLFGALIFFVLIMLL